jgi:hypothetical protein
MPSICWYCAGIAKYHQVSLSISFFQYICRMSKVLSNIVGIVRYRQVSPGIVKAQKSILTIWFLTVISWYFTVLVLDRQYWVSDQIRSESICLNFSRYQTFDPYTTLDAKWYNVECLICCFTFLLLCLVKL